MAIHYSPSPDAIACGRSGANLSSTEDQAQVSCKLCLRSIDKEAAPAVTRRTPTLAELRAAAKAEKAAAENTAKPTSKVSVRSAWRQKLEQMPGRNRLPRSAAKQKFV